MNEKETPNQLTKWHIIKSYEGQLSQYSMILLDDFYRQIVESIALNLEKFDLRAAEEVRKMNFTLK